MREELIKIIEEYLETLESYEPRYYEGSFDGNWKVRKIPTFTGFIEWITGKEISTNKESQG